MVLKLLFFPKNYKKSPSGWRLLPRPPIVIRLSYAMFAHLVYQCRHFRFLAFSSSPPSLAKSWLRAKPDQGF